jgi:hypothetical protein
VRRRVGYATRAESFAHGATPCASTIRSDATAFALSTLHTPQWSRPTTWLLAIQFLGGFAGPQPSLTGPFFLWLLILRFKKSSHGEIDLRSGLRLPPQRFVKTNPATPATHFAGIGFVAGASPVRRALSHRRIPVGGDGVSGQTVLCAEVAMRAAGPARATMCSFIAAGSARQGNRNAGPGQPRHATPLRLLGQAPFGGSWSYSSCVHSGTGSKRH